MDNIPLFNKRFAPFPEILASNRAQFRNMHDAMRCNIMNEIKPVLIIGTIVMRADAD